MLSMVGNSRGYFSVIYGRLSMVGTVGGISVLSMVGSSRGYFSVIYGRKQ